MVDEERLLIHGPTPHGACVGSGGARQVDGTGEECVILDDISGCTDAQDLRHGS